MKIAKEQCHVNFLITTGINNIVPKGLRRKSPISGHKASKIIEAANRIILRKRINYHRWRKRDLIKEAKLIHTDITSIVANEDL